MHVAQCLLSVNNSVSLYVCPECVSTEAFLFVPYPCIDFLIALKNVVEKQRD